MKKTQTIVGALIVALAGVSAMPVASATYLENMTFCQSEYGGADQTDEFQACLASDEGNGGACPIPPELSPKPECVVEP